MEILTDPPTELMVSLEIFWRFVHNHRLYVDQIAEAWRCGAIKTLTVTGEPPR
jgi:hypothetical protein